MSCRKDDDGHGAPLPNLLAYFDAIHLWQAEVEDDQRGSSRSGEVDAFACALGLQDGDDVAEGIAHDTTDLRLVIDDENAVSGHVGQSMWRRDAGIFFRQRVIRDCDVLQRAGRRWR